MALAGLVRQSRPVSSHPAPGSPTRGGATRARVGPADETDHLASQEDRELEREVVAEERRGLGDLVLAYRRELAPLGAAFAVVTVAAEGHQQAPARWPVPLLVGGVLTLAWHFRASRPAERLYAAGVGLLASCLTAAGWAFDVTHTWFWAVLGLGTLTGGLPWWRHQLPRGRLLGGRQAPKTMQQQAKAVVAAWPAIAAARGIAGVKLQQVTPDEFGWTMRLRIPTASKLTVKDVVGAVDGLQTSFRTRVGAVRVEPAPNRADLCVVRVSVTDPLGKPIDYPGLSSTSIAKPIRLGIFEDRADLSVLAPGGHWLMGGATGSGKSVTQRVLLAELLQREDVVCWGCDVAKAGVQFVPFVAGLARLATEPAEALTMLKAAMAAQRARAKWMAAGGLTEWPLSREHPQLVIVIDEVSDLLTIAGVGELLEQLVKLGREQGITVIAATQRASADALGDSAVARSQFGVRIALRCNDKGDGDLILGQGRASEGWRPDRLQAPGSILVRAEEQGLTVPRPGRTYLLPTREARRIAERAAPLLATLDEVTAAAVAEVDQAPAARAVASSGRRAAKPAAKSRVLGLLTEAGQDGIGAADLVAALSGEVAKSHVYRVLNELQAEGTVERDELSVWKVVHPGSEHGD